MACGVQRLIAGQQAGSDIFFDGRDGHAKLRGDIAVAHAVEFAQQQSRARLGRQLVQHRVDLAQRFDHQRARFLGRRDGLGRQRQHFQVGRLDLAAPVQVDHEAIGDLRQVAPRFVDRRHPARFHQMQIHIVRQIGRIEGVAELAAQQTTQPAMVVKVQTVDLLV